MRGKIRKIATICLLVVLGGCVTPVERTKYAAAEVCAVGSRLAGRANCWFVVCAFPGGNSPAVAVSTLYCDPARIKPVATPTAENGL